ncbi:MAG: 16S rRNA (guanine(966)-N(2))-methyltransferase RsmD [Ignavibacteriae bacterium]|nr:16S rRNA (guanine(966)-N(2))-methyltransferase RsmD [Ignavibacteriota bacterium]
MRIISGAYKGRRLKSPPKTSKVRPTTDRVRETLFNLITNRIDLKKAKVLDLFCGTGSLGIECLSRGALEAVFVDKDISTIKENVDMLEINDNVKVRKADAFRYLKKTEESFNLTFADPPYSFNNYDSLIKEASGKTQYLILEHSSSNRFEGETVMLRKDFGETSLTFFEFKK